MADSLELRSSRIGDSTLKRVLSYAMLPLVIPAYLVYEASFRVAQFSSFMQGRVEKIREDMKKGNLLDTDFPYS